MQCSFCILCGWSFYIRHLLVWFCVLIDGMYVLYILCVDYIIYNLYHMNGLTNNHCNIVMKYQSVSKELLRKT